MLNPILKWIVSWFRNEVEAPPPVVLVPPLFDFPPIAARNRMLESSYDVVFGKLALRCLFNDYFQQPKHFVTRIMLKPIDDPHVDLIATVSSLPHSYFIIDEFIIMILVSAIISFIS